MPTKTTHCTCGSSIKLTAASQKALDGVMALWWREHQGDGHGPATAAQARKARDHGTVGVRPSTNTRKAEVSDAATHS